MANSSNYRPLAEHQKLNARELIDKAFENAEITAMTEFMKRELVYALYKRCDMASVD
ncbi:hypothetical protein ABE288_04705 [Bacillus salipaludis]|uniref:hypothetical protein n=1 Tax=Bacillus salipaludis TaxID=2547811 RepID=UPI003D1F9EFD